MQGFRTIILSLVLGSLLTASHLGWAKVSNQYPFDAPEDYLAPAAAFSTWATTLELHATQRATLHECISGDASCRGRLRSFGHTLVKSKDLSDEEQISLVHYYINRSRYDDDHVKRKFDHSGRKVGIQRNHWTTLYDFLRQGGDCEDFATSKYFMLRELGFAADDLRIVIAYERKLRGYHAVLAVRRPNKDIWLLDSDNMIRKKSHRGYRYIYAMNETSVWDHRIDYNPDETLDNSTKSLDEPTKEVSSRE